MKRFGQRWGARKGATTARGSDERRRPTSGPQCATCQAFLYPEEVLNGDGDRCGPCGINARRGRAGEDVCRT